MRPLRQPFLILLCLALVTVPVTGDLSLTPEDPAPEDALGAAPACGEALVASTELVPLGPRSHDLLSACGGIRPGAPLVFHVGPLDLMYCTMAFVLTDGSDLYVATAGHCVKEGDGLPQRVAAHGIPGTFGEVAFTWCEGTDSAGNGCGLGADFGLIKVDEDKEHLVSGALCHWGAPTGGLFTEHDSTLRGVQHFGWGMFLGEPTGVVVTTGNPATQAREGIGIDFSEPNYALVETAAISGDSGSPALVLDGLSPPAMDIEQDPQALGVITHITNIGVFVQRLDESLDRAEQDLGVQLSLVTA